MVNRPLRLFMALLASAGCSGTLGAPEEDASAGAVSLDGVRSLTISPAEVTLDAGPDRAASQRFTVVATFADGTTRDVSTQVDYELRPALIGRIDRGAFQTSAIAGGESFVIARPSRTSTIVAMARVRVRWSASDLPASLPSDLASRFAAGAAATASAPRVIYPSDRVMFPPNLSGVEVHWMPEGAAVAYDLAFTSAATSVHLYRACTAANGGCTAALDGPFFRWIADTNRGAAEPVELRVRALRPDGTVATSAQTRLYFAPENVAGGLYYWAAARPHNGIYRYDFARGDRAPTPYVTAADSPADSAGNAHACVGCHAVSPDGRRMAAVLGGGHVANAVLFDVERREVTASRLERWAQLMTFNPSGSQLLGVRDGRLRLLDGRDLSATRDVDVGGLATHPDWSRANNGVAITRVDAQRESILVRRGAIGWMPFDGNQFGATATLAPAVRGENRYYPAPTPDGRWVIFNRSVCPRGVEPTDDFPENGGAFGSHPCDGYDDPSASLWIVDSNLPTHHAIALDAVNARGPNDTRDTLTNSWPKVSPFTSTWLDRTIYWVTFSSKRNYGLRLVGADRPQLWMVAVAVPDGEDPQALREDPSFAPFWLPFQDPSTSNHIAQWTREVVVPP
jgi:hypothetical protein